MKITIKQIFPRLLLVLGLVAIFLVPIPSQGQVPTCRGLYEGEFSAKKGWDTKVSYDSHAVCHLSATKTKPNGDVEQVKFQHNPNNGETSKDIATIHPDKSKEVERYQYWGEPSVYGRLQPRNEQPQWHLVAASETDSSGVTNAKTYDVDGHISSKTRSDGKGNEDKYTYDENNGLVSYEHKNANGSSLSETFDPKSCTDKDADGLGYGCKVISKTERYPQTGTTITTNEDNSTHVESKSAGGTSVSDTYPDGKPKSIITQLADGNSWQYTYDPTGAVTVVHTDPNKVSDSTSYDADGKVVSTIHTNADGSGTFADDDLGLYGGFSGPGPGDKPKQLGASNDHANQERPIKSTGKAKINADVLRQIGDSASADAIWQPSKSSNSGFQGGGINTSKPIQSSKPASPALPSGGTGGISMVKPNQPSQPSNSGFQGGGINMTKPVQSSKPASPALPSGGTGGISMVKPNQPSQPSNSGFQGGGINMTKPVQSSKPASPALPSGGTGGINKVGSQTQAVQHKTLFKPVQKLKIKPKNAGSSGGFVQPK